MSNPNTLGGEGWSHLFSTITNLAFSDENPNNCAYKLLEDHGVNILTQAVGAVLNPVLSRGAQDVVLRRWRQYVSGGSYNQAEFVRKEMPAWAEALDNN